jgi:outer membrane protein OmpA-like peptidoglycan-associated protein
MKKLYIPIIIFIGISINAIAQDKSRKEKQGDKYSFNYTYDKAIDSYNRAKHLTIDGQRKLAKSYSQMGENTEAEVAYAKLVNSATGVLPEDYYNYAMVLKSNAKYDESAKWMEIFNDQKPNDLRAKDYIANKSSLPVLLKDNGKFKIEHLNVNTDAQDFGTSFYKNKIVFASSRAFPKMIKRKYSWTGKPFLNMYASEVDGAQLKDPKIFGKSLDGKMHDGPASFSNDGTYMAFTRNNYNDKTKDRIVELQIYFSTGKDENWATPEPFAYNNSEYSVTHPCLTANGTTMYFTSDMPGGFGGADIYRTSKSEKGEWQKPENLGDKINTEGDELFPFIDETNQIFYFVSNGRFGLGGLDLFISPVVGSSFGTSYNAGSPLNTQYDDFAIAIDGKTNKGYFSSNKIGGSGDDDIYSVEILKTIEINKKINGIAKTENGKAIPKTFITLFNDKGEIIDTLTTKDDGAYSFSVDKDRDFVLTGKKEKYIEGSNTANTYGPKAIVIADITLLTKEEIVTRKIQEGADLGKILEFKSIYFDFHKYTIRPDAAAELDQIVKIMNQYPNMILKLSSYTDCRATKGYNQKLSENRAKASGDYIKKRIIKPARITSKGYGENNLVNGCACEGDIVSECSEDVHQENRRTEFIIVKKDALITKK